MKNILLLGAGLVARPLVRYLLSRRPDYRLTIGTKDVARAEELLGGHPHGRVLQLDVTHENELRPLVEQSDVVVSLLPAVLNPGVTKLAIELGKDVLNASYASQAMKELDEAARKRDVLVLCELGLDPGIDHMSAMQVIHRLQARGGKITRFSSCCGGLPSREDNDNPWGYKFSWFPRGVLLASRHDARYRRSGEVVDISGPELFRHHWPYLVRGAEGKFEIYPNRDSLAYEEIYGLEGVDDMFRGTIRFPGWSDTMYAVNKCGWLRTAPARWKPGMTYAAATLEGLGISDQDESTALQAASKALGLDEDDPVMLRLEWAGLLSSRPIPDPSQPPIDVLAGRLSKLLAYRPGELDLVVMQHDIRAEYEDGTREHVTASLVDKGIPHGDSSMSRTVSLPLAVATDLVLQLGRPEVGVQLPIFPEIYTPVLQELRELGISLQESSRVWHPGPFAS